MIRTFSFLYQAWNDPGFMEQILHLLDNPENAELHTDNLVLFFNAKAQYVSIRARYPDSEFAIKVIPMSISYSAMKKMLSKDFDHFLTGELMNSEHT